jgi:hypothetical protein
MLVLLCENQRWRQVGQGTLTHKPGKINLKLCLFTQELTTIKKNLDHAFDPQIILRWPQ